MEQRTAKAEQFIEDMLAYFGERIWFLGGVPVKGCETPDWVLVTSDFVSDKEIDFYNQELEELGLGGYCDGKEEFLQMDALYLLEAATKADIAVGKSETLLAAIDTGMLRLSIGEQAECAIKDIEYNLFEGKDITVLLEHLEQMDLLLDAISLYLSRLDIESQNRAKTGIPPLKSGINATIERITKGETVDFSHLCRCLIAWLGEWK